MLCYVMLHYIILLVVLVCYIEDFNVTYPYISAVTMTTKLPCAGSPSCKQQISAGDTCTSK